MDSAAGTITTDSDFALSNQVNAGSLVKMTAVPVKNLELKNSTKYECARKNLGTAGLPANTPIRVSYVNSSPSSAKKLHIYVEYMY